MVISPMGHSSVSYKLTSPVSKLQHCRSHFLRWLFEDLQSQYLPADGSVEDCRDVAATIHRRLANINGPLEANFVYLVKTTAGTVYVEGECGRDSCTVFLPANDFRHSEKQLNAPTISQTGTNITSTGGFPGGLEAFCGCLDEQL